MFQLTLPILFVELSIIPAPMTVNRRKYKEYSDFLHDQYFRR